MKQIFKLLLVTIWPAMLCAQQDSTRTSVLEADTLFKQDVAINMASFAELQRFLIQTEPENKAAILSTLGVPVRQKISTLDSLYQEEVLRFKNWVTRKSLKGKRKMQPYSYINTMIVLDKFFFYPDVYAILLNPVRMKIQPLLSPETRQAAFDQVASIMADLEQLNEPGKTQLMAVYREFKTRYPDSPHTLFQDTDTFSEAEKQAFELVNLVIYLNRE